MGSGTAGQQNLSAQQYGILIAAMCMYFFDSTFGAVASTYSLYPDYFGIAPAQVSWLTAVVIPLQIVGGLCVGTMVGNKISYRAAAITATAIFTFFGGLPFLWQDIPWHMLLFSRFIFGFGGGCINPLVQSIIVHMFQNETARAGWIGAINIIFSLGGVVANMICGFLAMNGVWQNAYAFYLFGIIPLVLVIIFMRDDKILADIPDNVSPEGCSQGPAMLEIRKWRLSDIPKMAIGFMCVFGLATIITGTFRDYMLIVIGQTGLDTLAVSMVFTVMPVFSLVAAAVNGVFWKRLGEWSFPLSFVFLFVGNVCCLLGYHGGGVATFVVGAAFLGFGRVLVAMTITMMLSTTVTPAALTLAIGLQEVARNLGAFLSAPWLNFVGSVFGDVPDVQIGGILLLAAIGIVAAFALATKARKNRLRSQ